MKFNFILIFYINLYNRNLKLCYSPLHEFIDKIYRNFAVNLYRKKKIYIIYIYTTVHWKTKNWIFFFTWYYKRFQSNIGALNYYFLVETEFISLKFPHEEMSKFENCDLKNENVKNFSYNRVFPVSAVTWIWDHHVWIVTVIIYMPGGTAD